MLDALPDTIWTIPAGRPGENVRRRPDVGNLKMSLDRKRQLWDLTYLGIFRGPDVAGPFLHLASYRKVYWLTIRFLFLDEFDVLTTATLLDLASVI
jgi:hypothetical protein